MGKFGENIKVEYTYGLVLSLSCRNKNLALTLEIEQNQLSPMKVLYFSILFISLIVSYEGL